MNRAFYIVGIVFSVIFMFVIGYFIGEVQDAKYMSMREMLSDYSNPYSTYRSYDSGLDDSITVSAGLWSMFFFLFYVAMDVLGLIKIKTTTTKVMAIIGLSLTAIFLIWDFGMMAEPGALSFDEVGGGFAFYSMIMLAFSIVGLVQSVRFYKLQNSPSVAPIKAESQDILDI